MKQIQKNIGRLLPSKSWMGLLAGLFMSHSAMAQASDEVIIVPASQSNPSAPHIAHRNAPITLKAIVRNCSSASGYTIAWDENRNGNFDDDYSFAVTRNSITLALQDIGRSVTIPNVTGEPTLTYNVRVRVPGGADKFAAFNVKVQDFIPSNDPRNWTVAQLETMRKMAVQENLWFLHRSMTGFSGNHTGNQIQGNIQNDPNNALTTPTALWIFTSNGRLPAYPPGTYTGAAPADFAQKNNARWNNDPYAETAMRLFNKSLLTLSFANISGGEEQNRIGYTNGVPIFASPIAGTDNNAALRTIASAHDGGDNAANGYVLQGIASTLPALGGTVAVMGQGGTVTGRSIEYICQEIVDWLGFAQNEAGTGYSGLWYYSANQGGGLWDGTGSAIMGLIAAEKHGRAYGVIVDNLHKYRIAESLVARQRGDGGVTRFVQNNDPSSFQHTGYAIAACRWLGIHNFPSDGFVPFPQEAPGRVRGQLRQAYDRYVNFIASKWAVSNQLDPFWVDGLWQTGDYLGNNVNAVYNGPTHGNLYALAIHSFAYSHAGPELSLVGSRDGRREIFIYGIRSQSRVASSSRDGNYTNFGKVNQSCWGTAYSCYFEPGFWPSVLLGQSLTTAIPLEPEIQVEGNSVEIVDGTTTVSTTNHTDFGSGSSLQRTFTIRNTGGGPLDLTTPFTISGTNAADFQVVSGPALTTVPASGTTTFTVGFTAGSSGVRSATITIANNDADEASYDFAVQATAPAIVDQAFAVYENTPNGSLVGTVVAANGLTLAITAGNEAGAFAMDSITGDLTVADSSLLNFEATSSFSLTVEVSESGSPIATATVTINVNNRNDAPVGADKTVSLLKDTDYAFTESDFGFSDSDVPANKFVALKITTAPPAGTLKVNGSAVSAGTTVTLAGPAGDTWVSRTGSGSRDWLSMGSSGDGSVLLGGTWGGPAVISTDFGVTWTERMPGVTVTASASSADGSRWVVVTRQNRIFTSTDTGTNWIARENSRYWADVASSADGMKLIAADGSPGFLYTSTDGGANWTVRLTDSNRPWYSVASSADGTKLVAVAGGEYIYTSTDSGLTWTPRATQNSWYKVASSADGTKLVATAAAQIYTSVDSGVNWTVQPGAGTRSWNELASSADGTRLVAVVNGGQIYTSIDSGVNWVARDSNRFWRALAISLDGSRMAASPGGSANAGTVYTSTGDKIFPVFSPAASESGSPYASFTFQVQDDGGTANGGIDLDPTPRTITINVTNANEAPIDITLNNDSIAENEVSGTAVGTLSANDPDIGDSHTFALVSGEGSTDNGSFTIDGNVLKTDASFDYETKDSYSVRVSATDSKGEVFAKVLVITVANVVEPIAITGQPAEQSIAIGATATLTVSVTGDAPQYQWRKSGDAIPDATDSSLIIADFQTSDAAAYDVAVSNGSGSVDSATAWLYVNGAESELPKVTVVFPDSSERITNDLEITISGKASDTQLGLAQVLYSLNGADYQPAEGTTNWTADVTVVPGTNVVQVKAIDLGNNESTVVTRRFYAVILSPLTLTSNGFGSFLGENSSLGKPADGAMLEVGRSYVVTAVPAINNLFSNWTDGVVSTNAKLKFIMESNMVLHANFVTNKFIAASGIYNGLFSASSGVAFESAGFVTLKVNPKLGVSGKLRVDGNVVVFSGKMNVDGTFSRMTQKRTRSTDKPELQVDLALDFSGSDTLTGNVELPGQGGWTSDIVAHRIVWSKLGQPQATDYTNSYTMLIPGSGQEGEGPIGTGFSSLKVDLLGKTRLLGRAADGMLLKQGVSLSKNGDVPFFSPLYYKKRTNDLLRPIQESKGFVMGWLQFTNNNGEGNLAPVGEVHWIKTAWTNATYDAYPTGFTNSADVIGSRWKAPELNSGDRAIDMEEALLTFSEGNLSNPFEATFAVTTNTTLTVIKPVTPETYPNSVKAGLAAKTGLFRGTFQHPSDPLLRIYWYGALLQDQNYGEGLFMGPIVGGKVTLEDAGEMK